MLLQYMSKIFRFIVASLQVEQTLSMTLSSHLLNDIVGSPTDVDSTITFRAAFFGFAISAMLVVASYSAPAADVHRKASSE